MQHNNQRRPQDLELRPRCLQARTSSHHVLEERVARKAGQDSKSGVGDEDRLQAKEGIGAGRH